MKTKKETTLSVLKEIRNLLKAGVNRIQEVPEKEDLSNFIKVDFPEKTAKEIVDECNNTLGSGKLLHNTYWYKDEDFFTKEKCRPGTRYVSKELIGKGKDWDECVKLAKEEKGEMLNFPETVFFIQEYYKQMKSYPWNKDYSWSSSRSSDGGLVSVGLCGAAGVLVGYDGPGRSYSRLGVCFSGSEIVKK
jgi:hypothetical protein